MNAGLVERFEGLGAKVLEDSLRWRSGTMRDYGELAGFHYLRNKPVTATRVMVVECADADLAERWGRLGCGMRESETGTETGDTDVPGEETVFVEKRTIARARIGEDRSTFCAIKQDKLGYTRRSDNNSVFVEKRTENRANFGGGHGRVVGVLVESLPALSCRLRDVATGGRYGGWKDRGAGARLLNAEVRCISRVVVHPQWRGMGLAVKLVRKALETMTTPYTEALAAMGRVHPFFRLAGMTEYRRPALEGRQRLIDAMRYCGVEAWELASEERMREVLGEEPASLKRGAPEERGVALLRRELARWAGRRLTLGEQLEKAREELLCEPVYYGFRRD